jgi:hypothetical protein
MSSPRLNRNQTLDVRIELADPRELFAAPSPDPLSGQPHGESGIDRILNQLRPRPKRSVRATLALPAAVRSADFESRCRQAIQDYCDARIAHICNDRSSLWYEGRATLVRGLLFLGLCMLGSRIVGEPRYLHAVIARFLDEGFVIAGWVALWYPLDALLYQHWPLARERRLYQAVREMDVGFEYRAALPAEAQGTTSP